MKPVLFAYNVRSLTFPLPFSLSPSLPPTSLILASSSASLLLFCRSRSRRESREIPDYFFGAKNSILREREKGGRAIIECIFCLVRAAEDDSISLDWKYANCASEVNECVIFFDARLGDVIF